VNEHTSSLKSVTTAVHDSTVKTVQEQMQHLDTQLHGLDDIVVRIKDQNNIHHAAHVASLANLATNVQASYSSIGEHFTTSFSRVSELDKDMSARATSLQETLPLLSDAGEIRRPLMDLRETIEDQVLEEYKATGETPQRASYNIPISMPRTEPHDSLLTKFRRRSSSTPLASPAKSNRSPSKGLIFTDTFADVTSLVPTSTRPGTSSSSGTESSLGLRELDANAYVIPPTSLNEKDGLGALGMPPLKRQHTTGTHSGGDSKLPLKKRSARMTVAGGTAVASMADRENQPVNLSASVGPGSGVGRRLRSNGSS
jgi:kinesin family protein 11